ncbi:hypothetical protein FRB91_010424 [Serendipita sp. 411]|nr:hypothetical protein FRB91_010424 [Serendipita sp. 411]
MAPNHPLALMITRVRLSPVVIAIVAWTSFSLTFARNFTIYNACPFTIWPAIYTDLKVGTALPSPNNVTGWEAPPWSTRSFEIPDNWRAGRIWGRRDCDFSKDSGPNSCLTGSCIGTGLNCDLQIGTGVPPATVAEWTLEGENGVDHYDVSLVDGYNLPMRITNNKGCPIAECAIDLSPTCPAALRGPTDSNGWVTGCMSSCFANLTGNPANSKDCCSGEYDTPATCPYQNVDYYWYFKGNCPNAYAYAYDEFSGTALWTCLGSLKADYTLTFCP